MITPAAVSGGLRQLAADGDPLVRVGAAQALAAAGPRLALTPLTIAAADPHAGVRKAP